jgi:hypothetical protein
MKILAGTSLEVNTRRALRRTLQYLHSAVQEVAVKKVAIKDAADRLVVLRSERNSMTLPGVDNTAIFIILIFGIIAVYWVDYLLFGSIAEYFAKKTFGPASTIAKFAPTVGPLLIISIELAIAAQVYMAKERAIDLEGSIWIYRGWLFVGLILAVVMPSAAVAMNLVSFQDFSALPPALKMLQITTVAIAFVSHIGILFGGRSAQEAKDWLRNRMQTWRWRRKGARAESHLIVLVSSSLDLFQMYKDKVINAQEAGILILPGSIDASARKLLLEQFGRDVVEELDEILGGVQLNRPALLRAPNDPSDTSHSSNGDGRLQSVLPVIVEEHGGEASSSR